MNAIPATTDVFQRWADPDRPVITDPQQLKTGTMGVVIRRPGHWITAIMNFAAGIVYVIDPQHYSHPLVAKALIDWYYDTFKLAFNEDSTIKWTVILSRRRQNPIKTPRQNDGSSCGIFVALILFLYMSYGSLPDATAFEMKDILLARLFLLHHIMEGKRRRNPVIDLLMEEDITYTPEEVAMQQALFNYYAKDVKICELVVID